MNNIFSWIGGKKNITSTSLLENMTDIHTHFLPGVDDGVRTVEESIASLQELQRMGLRQAYLTPHVMSDMESNNRESLLARFQEFKDLVPYGIEVRLAAEYMLDEAFERQRKNGLLTMKDNHVLVETSYLSPPPGLPEILHETTSDGYQPIIAHPERYMYMTKNDYHALKDIGYKFQMNLFSLSGYYGIPAQKKCRYLLKLNFYDFIGSDFHSMEKFNRGLSQLNLTPSQQKKFSVLLENNHLLW